MLAECMHENTTVYSYRRVYHGLQKLLEVGDDDKDQTSRNPRPKITNKSQKEKLVHFVALGKDINIEGIHVYTDNRTIYSICITCTIMQLTMRVKLLVECSIKMPIQNNSGVNLKSLLMKYK